MAVFDCTQSNVLPALDLVWAGLNGIGAAAASNDNMNPDQSQIIGVGVAWLVISGISAIYGFNKVSQCNDARRMRDERYYPGDGPAAARPAGPAAPAAAPAPSGAPPPAALPPPAVPGPGAPPSETPPAPPAAPPPSGAGPSSALPARMPRTLAMRTAE